FQGSLYGLPAAVIKECIAGAIEARFGPLKPARNGHANGANGTNGIHAVNGKTNGHATCNTDAIKDCCADGILEASVPLAESKAAPRNFEEFIYKVWGAGIAKHFAIPYNRKLWAVPLEEMETSWLGGRVPLPDLEEIIEGALSPKPKPMGPNARFGYPLRGGFQALMDAWLPHLKGELQLNSRVLKVSPSRHTVTLDSGETIPYKYLVSTMPLPVLIAQMGDEAPAEIREAAGSLRYVSVRCVHIGVGRENLTEKHWIYYPEDTVFHRIFVQGNASPHCNPPGGFGLTCEITYSPHKPLPCDGDDLIRRCIEDCHKVGFFRPEDPVWAAAQCDLPFAYVVYDHGRAAAVAHIREWLEQRQILLSGRYSEWEYYNSDHAFLAGKNAADKVRELEAQNLTAFQPVAAGLLEQFGPRL
ncbi:MAG: FAD-dependent oxidoreductase, partial [Acidobacteriia bacterium]|nr:FAD-dependent oxidoreductase [Terriglobia bacterium]